MCKQLIFHNKNDSDKNRKIQPCLKQTAEKTAQTVVTKQVCHRTEVCNTVFDRIVLRSKQWMPKKAQMLMLKTEGKKNKCVKGSCAKLMTIKHLTVEKFNNEQNSNHQNQSRVGINIHQIWRHHDKHLKSSQPCFNDNPTYPSYS